jgi:hypothetical protein
MTEGIPHEIPHGIPSATPDTRRSSPISVLLLEEVDDRRLSPSTTYIVRLVGSVVKASDVSAS